jgi:hypothetical protein
LVRFASDSNPNNNFIRQMYLDLVGSEPSCAQYIAALDRLNNGESRAQVAGSLTRDPTHRLRAVREQVSRFLHLDASGDSAVDIVARFPDFSHAPSGDTEGGLAIGPYLAGMDTGSIGLPVNFLIVVAHILASTAHASGHGLMVDDFNTVSRDLLIPILFQDFMVSQPAPMEVAAIVQQFILVPLLSFAQRTSLAATFFVAHRRFLEPLVESYYQLYLHRMFDTGGRDGWVNALFSGLSAEQVVAGFVGSQEYFNNAQS